MAKVAICAFGWLLMSVGAVLSAERCPPNDFPMETGLALATRGELKSLDPYALDESFTLSMLGNVYEGLVRRDQAGNIVSGLAERWETKDYTTWRFFLKKGVKFQQGQEFTTDDVIYSSKRVRARGSDLRSRLPSDAKVIKVDDYTVDFILASANPLLDSEWDTWYILPRPWTDAGKAEDPDSIDTANSVVATRTNGTGPYSISFHKAGTSSIFVPNPQWWSNTPNFEKIALCTVANDVDRIDLLLSGRVQLAEPVLPADIQRVNVSQGFEVLEPTAEFRTIFLGFDVLRDQLENSDAENNPFKDPQVRTAIYYAIDAESIKSKLHNNAVLANSIVAPAISSPASNIGRRPYDLKTARDLLAKAGYPDGFTVQLDCPVGLYINDEEICRAVRDMLLAVGIEVTLNIEPKAQFLSTISSYDTSFFLFGWAPESFDVWNVLNNLVSCRDGSKLAGRFNVGGFCDAGIDALIAKIRVEPDPSVRNAFVTDVLKRMYDDSVYVPLHQQMLIWGVNKKFTFPQRKNDRIVFNEIAKQ